MNSRELLQQALEFAERICGDRCNAEYNPCEAKDLAEAIRAHLAKEPEPVAWIQYEDGAVRMTTGDVTHRPGEWTPLYRLEDM